MGLQQAQAQLTAAKLVLQRNGLTLDAAGPVVVRAPVDVGALQDEAAALRTSVAEQAAALTKLEEGVRAYRFQARTARNQLAQQQTEHADTVMRLNRRIAELEDYLKRLEAGDSLGVRAWVGSVCFL